MKPERLAAKKKIPKKITREYLHNSGLYYLQRFSSSKKNFINVMLRKARKSCMHHTEQSYEDCATLVTEIADRFEKSGLLNDDLYTRGMVTSLRRRGLSGSAILNKMNQKGIARDVTTEKLHDVDTDSYPNEKDAEMQAALRLAQKKKLGPYHADPQSQDKRKSLAYFARAGFSYDIANQILSMSQPPDSAPY